ncbi:MAG: glycosyltransferase family 39 protein [Flavobacteriales bacterium]|nr:glycosyltransferase family 39 protein [Flavobacteriales bacterium]
MQAHNTGSKVWRIALLLLLAYGLGCRIHALLSWKTTLSGDESVSYMCAAASAGVWETTIADLIDTPIAVADLQRFYDRPAQFDFHTVSVDMARYDVHPPLYFWLLHIIHVLWGTTAATGAWLNVVFGLGVLLLLARLARSLTGSDTAALAVAVVWYLSPAAVQIDLEARPYQLLALLTLASYMLGLRLVNGGAGRWTWIGFTAVNMLGLLTHLYFPFLLLPGVVLMYAHHGTGRGTWLYLGSLLASLAGMLLFYPEFIEFLTTFGDRPRDVPEPVDHVGRLKGVVYTSMQFLTEPHLLRYGYLALSAIAVALLVRKAIRSARTWKLDLRSDRAALFITLGWWAFFTIVLFLVGVSPAQAVGEQYFAYIWPLAAIVGVLATGALLKGVARRWALGIHLALLVLSFSLAVRRSEYLKPAIPAAWNSTIAGSELLITDEAKRTALPRMSRHLPGELPLYIVLGTKRPDLRGIRHVTFLHLDIRDRPLEPLLTWLAEQGFRPEGRTLAYDRYELRSFTR